MRLLLASLVLVLTSPVLAAVPPALTPAESATFWGSPEDAVPVSRNAYKKENEGQHFLYCDELHLELFEPYLRDLGGGYMGVGTDQGYLFIGWMRPSFAWLTDYDPLVQVMHRIYAAFFAESETQKDFLALWRDREKALAVLEKRYPGDAALAKLYVQQQYYTIRRLEYLAKAAIGKTHWKTYMNDAEDYAYVRGLVAAKRVRPMLGNLLADKGLKGAGEAARKLGVPIRALYVSNAEQYWKFSDGYRANINALPYDGKSWIVRSQASKPSNHDYRYYLQAASQFQAQLANPKIQTVYQAVPYVNIVDPVTAPLTVLDPDGKRTLKWSSPPKKPEAATAPATPAP